MKLAALYAPYNFSSTKCFVVTLVVDNSIKKIDEKIPPVARKLKGVFVSCRSTTNLKLLGTINLNFNDGALKPYNIPAVNGSNANLKNTSPISFDEDLKPHANMTGYYRDFGFGALSPGNSLTIKIYIHYGV